MGVTQSIRRTLDFGRVPVRDIRDDLIERLEAANSEMATARTQYDLERRVLEANFSSLFESISNKQRALETLLGTEAREFGEQPVRRAPAPTAMRLPLADFSVNCVGGVSGSKSKDEIKDLVERAGYVSEHESAGRMVHTTLLNLVRSGRLKQFGDEYASPMLRQEPPSSVVTRGLLYVGRSEIEHEEGPPAYRADEPLF